MYSRMYKHADWVPCSQQKLSIPTTLGPEGVQYTEKFGILKVQLNDIISHFLHPCEVPAGAAGSCIASYL